MASRKYYVAIAKVLADARPRPGDGTLETQKAADHVVDRVADGLADVLKADNAAFDRQRFLKAAENR